MTTATTTAATAGTIPATTTPAPATPAAPTVETFDVVGMTCRQCEVAVTAELSKLPGVERIVVDVAAGTVTTTSDRPLPRHAVAAAVDDAGYELA